jgi:ring-1,2-phenylacetyl-CoA epoxidase subunit PaaD
VVAVVFNPSGQGDSVSTANVRTDSDAEVNAIWDLLDEVKDPEIPVLSLWDLGVLRSVEKILDKIIITITPTYSGCPAMETMRNDIESILSESGYPNHEIRTVLSPAWTTDWMSDEGKQKLEQFGIAPPGHTTAEIQTVCCPRCRSGDTLLISEYGSTACKAMYQCSQCKEAFCYFKVI